MLELYSRELLGYVPNSEGSLENSITEVSHASVNDSIMPAQNQAADEDMRRQMEQLRRGKEKSLLEKHQEKLAKAKDDSSAPVRSKWNRCVNLIYFNYILQIQ